MITMHPDKFKLLYEDDAIIAIDKTSGTPVIPERWETRKIDLFSLLNMHYLTNEVSHYYVIHRIDRDCSGIVIFAKDKSSHRFLSMEFENRQVHKEYAAIAVGAFIPSKGMIDLPLFQRKKGPLRSIVRNDGKPSQTFYEVIQQYTKYAFLKLIPHTGRPNQLRVHLAHSAHPIACDPLYNKNTKPIVDSMGTILLNRLALHAHKLSFTHPSSHATMELTSPFPSDFQSCLDYLFSITEII